MKIKTEFKKPGIYCIINIKNGHKYIGSSTNMHQRLMCHHSWLRRGSHHSIYLQRAWNKYKEENFKFEIIEECLEENLKAKEEYYLLNLKPVYNICKEAYSTAGREYKESTRLKHRKYALENNINPPEYTWKNKMKKIIMLDYNSLKELQVFESVSEACRFIGKDHTYATTLSDVCNGKRKSAFKYKWKWG